MSKFYSIEQCMRKSDQHWDMAGLARADGDTKDAKHQTEQALLWRDRARNGGWYVQTTE